MKIHKGSIENNRIDVLCGNPQAKKASSNWEEVDCANCHKVTLFEVNPL